MSKQLQLDALRKKIEEIDLPLKEGHNLVFGKGNAEAAIMFIGEAPGAQEDAQRIPFVGSAGKQLDRLLSSISMNSGDVYVANILKYRPPENRNPLPEEIRVHTPYLVEQIRIIRPKIIVTLGNFATKFVFAGFDTEKMGDIDGISKLRGRIIKIILDDAPFLVLPTYHPAAILHNPNLRNDLEDDFRLLGKIISMQEI